MLLGGSLEVKLPTIWTDEAAEIGRGREENKSQKRKEEQEQKSEEKETEEKKSENREEEERGLRRAKR